MLQAKNVNLYLNKDNRLLIEDFSFSLGEGDKVVIIGEEGNGKSTLLKYLYDEAMVADYVQATGQVIKKGVFGYLPQFMPEEEQKQSVYEYFQDVDIYENNALIDSLGLDYEFLFSTQMIHTLSGGEKVKIQLLKLLCQKPDALFLDEPTNDLDIDTLMFLEEFIKRCTISILFISHDELLISNTANVIIHLEQLIRKQKSVITVSRLHYEEYVNYRNLQFDKQTQVALKERAEYKKKKERLQQLYEKARHNKSWINPDGIISTDGGAKRSMQAIISRGKRFEREKENFTDIPNREEGIVTRFDADIYIPPHKRILDFSLPELKVDEKLLAKDINLSVIGNQHICIIGKNGVGKSTLLKEIWNVLKERQDIVASYMPQNYKDIINYSLTPAEFLRSNYDKEKYTLALTHMGTMKFTRDEMQHTIGELSGGQRAKIIFLNMVLQKANVLVLDEPTRNFSPLSAPVIRQALMDFRGTIISISHDRKYLDEVADVVYVLSEDGLKLFQ
ncbi:ATP-binding cassette domain-containing protein [Anaerotignum sp.]